MCQLCAYSPKKVTFLLYRGERIYLTFQWHMTRKRLHSPPCRRSHSPGSTGASPSRCGGPRIKLAAEQSWRGASFHVSVWHPGSGSAVRQRSLWPCTSCPPGWESLDFWVFPCDSCTAGAHELPRWLNPKSLQRDTVNLSETVYLFFFFFQLNLITKGSKSS